MLLISAANTVSKERRVQVTLCSFRCWEPWVLQLWIGLQFTRNTLCRPSIWEEWIYCGHLSYYRIFLHKNNPVVKQKLYGQTEKMLTWEFLVVLLDKGKNRKALHLLVPNRSSLQAVSQLVWFCSQGICAAQHRHEDHAGFVVQHGAGLGLLRIIFLLITNSLMVSWWGSPQC